eukprot:5746925-Prymnesium_polylepis.1
MKSAAVVALALLESVQAFQAPAAVKAPRSSAVTMFAEGDVGVTAPLGVWDPLGLIGTRNMRRYEIMEIKHGRAAMLVRRALPLCSSALLWPHAVVTARWGALVARGSCVRRTVGGRVVAARARNTRASGA